MATHHVEDNDRGDEPDTDTGDESTDNNGGKRRGGKHLDDDSARVNDGAGDDGRSASHSVR